ncbi:hypothetical protein PAL_GLEAN10001639 [Pteropus alecto]|uniref:Uncharacterized protein n=1 Tax=Pteropus alecto TaxID=9402 RepID=L5K4J4_PTEAL|nr:hypothetical protein PAL_GLEAN10001639 [Pteropus alecto]
MPTLLVGPWPENSRASAKSVTAPVLADTIDGAAVSTLSAEPESPPLPPGGAADMTGAGSEKCQIPVHSLRPQPTPPDCAEACGQHKSPLPPRNLF